MNKIAGSMEEILAAHVDGFHQYILDEPVRLAFVSRSFCDMLGCTEEELLSGGDPYAALIHPADREAYAGLLRRAAGREQHLTLQYRIVRKDGGIRHVSDSFTSKRLEDGTMTGSSVLTDITPLKTENRDLHFLSETIPCGFIRYTCEKHPKITYINERMLQMLRVPDGDDCREMYTGNIYLMIPVEERRRFSRFLEEVYEQSAPAAGEMTVLRCDGTRARLYGWVTRSADEQGREEFQSVCMDVTEQYSSRRKSETERYLHALTEVYDRIFEYDLSARTVKCICGQHSDVFRWLQNIPMQIEDATEKWISGSVIPVDRERVRRFFTDYFRRTDDGRPPQIKYRALSSDGTVKTYAGIFLRLDSTVSFFCCRVISEGESDSLRSENDSLRSMNENMQELVMRFTDGIVAFEVEDGRVRPLYASDNVCLFFGCTKEEWLSMANLQLTIREFVSKSTVGYEDFMELFENGEAEFEYFDVSTGQLRRIRAVCSHMAEDSSRQYVMLYNAEKKEPAVQTKPAGSPRVYIRTFGYFDVFVDDSPIAFRNEKSKELFALLVDRRGGYVSSEEAIGFLWEDETANSVTLARYRKVALRLKNILEEYGIPDIVESVNGRRRIVTEKVRCDLYDYLGGGEEYAQLFKGSYLTNYSWSENTLGELLNRQ